METGGIKNEAGKLVTEKKDVMNRQSKYIEQLFDVDIGKKFIIREGTSGLPKLKEEAASIIKKMKKGKATSPDQVVVKMIEAAGGTALDKFTLLLNKIYVIGTIPTEISKSIFIITIPKKAGALECENH